MKLEMKVKKVFNIHKKTIFTGDITTAMPIVSAVMCRLLLDDVEIDHIEISGEVFSNGTDRDLWTYQHIEISQDTLNEHDVRLISV